MIRYIKLESGPTGKGSATIAVAHIVQWYSLNDKQTQIRLVNQDALTVDMPYEEFDAIMKVKLDF